MISVFGSLDFNSKAYNAVFDFWSEPVKSRPQPKAKLNIKNFWRAAIMAVALNTSVWAEMRSLPSQPFLGYSYSTVNTGPSVFAVGESLAHIQVLENSFLNIDKPVLVSNMDTVQIAQTTSTTGGALTAVDNGSFSMGGVLNADVEALPLVSRAVGNLIGENGLQRVEDFAKARDGWDGRGSLGLKPSSLETMNRFFGAGDFAPLDIAVFLSREGQVVANWTCDEKLVELEFTETGADYFLEFNDSEGSVDRHNFGDFKRLLTSISAVARGGQNQSS